MLSIITTWCDRSELCQTLPLNLSLLHERDYDVEVLVINVGGNLRKLTTLFASIEDPILRLIDLPSDSFNKSLALNIAAFCSTRENIFMVDADVILNADVLCEMQDTLSAGTFVTIRTVIESRPAPLESRLREMVETTKYLCRDGKKASIEYRAGGDGSRCGPGLILVKKKDFISVGGFNSALEHWGFEDYDFQLRLQFELGLRRKTVGKVVHLSHNPYSARSKMVKRSDSLPWNRAIAERNYSRGNFIGTYSQDLEKWKGRFADVAYLSD